MQLFEFLKQFQWWMYWASHWWIRLDFDCNFEVWCEKRVAPRQVLGLQFLQGKSVLRMAVLWGSFRRVPLPSNGSLPSSNSPTWRIRSQSCLHRNHPRTSFAFRTTRARLVAGTDSFSCVHWFLRRSLEVWTLSRHHMSKILVDQTCWVYLLVKQAQSSTLDL